MGNFDSLDETFDITPVKEEIKSIKKKSKELIISNKEDDAEKDYQYARAQIYDLVEKMTECVDGAMEAAEESGHPRAWEVAMNGAKSAAEVVEKLQDLHKKTKEASIEEVRVQNQTTNNVFMSGSTADLMKMLKDVNNK